MNSTEQKATLEIIKQSLADALDTLDAIAAWDDPQTDELVSAEQARECLKRIRGRDGRPKPKERKDKP